MENSIKTLEKNQGELKEIERKSRGNTGGFVRKSKEDPHEIAREMPRKK